MLILFHFQKWKTCAVTETAPRHRRKLGTKGTAEAPQQHQPCLGGCGPSVLFPALLFPLCAGVPRSTELPRRSQSVPLVQRRCEEHSPFTVSALFRSDLPRRSLRRSDLPWRSRRRSVLPWRSRRRSDLPGAHDGAPICPALTTALRSTRRSRRRSDRPRREEP